MKDKMKHTTYLIEVEDFRDMTNTLYFKSKPFWMVHDRDYYKSLKTYITFLKDLLENPFKYLKDPTYLFYETTTQMIATRLIKGDNLVFTFNCITSKHENNYRSILVSKDYISIKKDSKHLRPFNNSIIQKLKRFLRKLL